MSERRALLLLLLIIAVVALYIWGRPGAAAKPGTPGKAEAEERAKADPFPATDK